MLNMFLVEHFAAIVDKARTLQKLAGWPIEPMSERIKAAGIPVDRLLRRNEQMWKSVWGGR